MEVYRLGDKSNLDFMVIEDDGTVTVSVNCKGKVIEYEAKPIAGVGGVTRLEYGSGSSLPYKKANGDMDDKYVKIENN